MRKHYFFYAFVLLLTSFWACIPPSSEEKITDINAIDFNDPTIKKLYTFQDQLLTDSLTPYLKSKYPTLRYVAAQAFASVKDKKALVGLEELLKDEVDKVKTAAAFAIGQIGDSTSTNALVGSFVQSDTAGLQKHFNATVLEAMGKCAPASYLKLIASTNSYKNTDTTLLEGQCLAVYRFATRGITAAEGTQKMISYIGSSRYPNSVRLIAANYLARAKDITIDSVAASSLGVTFSTDNDYRIRMALGKALGKAQSITTLYTLINQLGRESDYRVKCATINALGNFNYFTVQPVISNFLRDKNPHVANAAAEFYLNHGNEKDAATIYWALAKDTSLSSIVQLKMYRATNRYVSSFMQNTKGIVNAELYRKLNQTNNPQEKVETLRALAEYGWNYKFIKENGFATQSPLVRTSTLEILNEIAANPSFFRIFASGAQTVRISLFQYYLEALEIGDVGMVAVAANGLRTPSMAYQYIYTKMLDKTFLTNAQNKLKLPKDIETWNELQKTIDFFNNTTSEPKKPAYNQPIDWKLLNAYSRSPKVRITTQYGDIVAELYRDKTPGTVVNFIQLANNNFFNGKNFHRVVSNFVVQGGCSRGDGYGALDYTIRSEFLPVHWDNEGYLGMASSGNHTEGTQFFISNAPAFHLDGNYTIFGKVLEGMDIVHKIQAGDIMKSVVVK
jgi:cyclophilin family peptidyl-prolyl cis-trans isomerase/HEAT repeat protein